MSLVFEENLATELLEEKTLLSQWQEAQAIQLGSLRRNFPRLGCDRLTIWRFSPIWSKHFLSTQGTGFSQLEPHLMQGFDPK